MRLARDGEKISRARWQDLLAEAGQLVVADQERAVGIAGVMGGEETGVTDSTKNILLEAAYFSAGKRSPDGAQVESTERRQLSIRARRRSGNDSCAHRNARRN